MLKEKELIVAFFCSACACLTGLEKFALGSRLFYALSTYCYQPGEKMSMQKSETQMWKWLNPGRGSAKANGCARSHNEKHTLLQSVLL